MPNYQLDVTDAVELAEMPQFLHRRLTIDHATLNDSLTRFVGHPAYNADTLQADLARFAFLLGASDGQDLFEPQPP